MHTWKPTVLRLSLGRGGGFGGSGGHSFERGFGVMTHRAPFENGMCGPNEEVGADGTCVPVGTVMMMGQAVPPSAPSSSASVGVTAAIVGLGAGAAQLLTGDGSMLNKIAFWTEIGALVVLAGAVIGQK